MLPRLNLSFKSTHHLITILGLKHDESEGKSGLNEVSYEFVEMPFLRCVVGLNEVWNDIEVLDINAKLVATSSALSVLTNSTAWVSTANIATC